MKMTARSIKDITFQWYPFDSRKLFDFNQNYSRNVNFNSPDRSNSLMHVNKILADSYKDRFKEELNRAMAVCWEQIFAKTEKNPDKILGLMGRSITKEGQLLVQRLCDMESGLYQAIQKIAEKVLREVKGYYSKRSMMDVVVDVFYSKESFVNRVYSLIVKQSTLQPRTLNHILKNY